MPNTADLDSTIFRHLTGKAKPALVHPTNSAFDPEAWRPVVDAIADGTTARDEVLIQPAMLTGLQNLVLRQLYTSTLFAGFTADQILTLALANANRGYLVIQHKAQAAAEAASAAAGDRPLDFGAISQLLIEPSPGQSPATADDLNTSFIDTLPHWFALTRDIPHGSRTPGENLGAVAQRAGAVLSLEHGFRSVWQEALWEPWRFHNRNGGGYLMVLTDADWMAGWRVWDLREQSLHLQGAMLNRQLEKAIPNAHLTRSLAQTVTAIELDCVPPKVTIDAPDENMAIGHRMSIDAITDAYTFVFVDQVVGAPGVTVALLSEVVLVLQDLVTAALPDEYDPVAPDWGIMERLACKLPRTTVVDAVRRALVIDRSLADACVAFLTVDPTLDLSELFRIGLWHRPLVATNGGEHVVIAAGALIWGSSIRRTERWLQTKSGDDLSKTPNGIIYEAQTRASIKDALEENPIFSPKDWSVSHIPKGQAKEEIDLLVRIGNRVLVGEIKCFLGPSEPSECYNYLRKLEKAAEQARRKAIWLSSEPSLIAQLLGGSGTFETVPLVVVNQSNGVGLVFDGCQVTDAHYLRIVLGDGNYHRGAKFEDTKPIHFNVETLYSSVGEAEAVLRHVFAEHLGVQRYREAVRWTTNLIPLANGEGSLEIAYPIVDEEAYYAAGPFAGQGG